MYVCVCGYVLGMTGYFELCVKCVFTVRSSPTLCFLSHASAHDKNDDDDNNDEDDH